MQLILPRHLSGLCSVWVQVSGLSRLDPRVYLVQNAYVVVQSALLLQRAPVLPAFRDVQNNSVNAIMFIEINVFANVEV